MELHAFSTVGREDAQGEPLKEELVIQNIEGVVLEDATMHRPGDGLPIVFLHGFGSTKEDYADIVHYRALGGRPMIAYDAPGCGDTRCVDLSKVSIPFLVAMATAVLAHFNVVRFHFVGHPMGGLTALMLAHESPQRMASLIEIEGNVAPEDCFLSRQVVPMYSNPVCMWERIAAFLC